MNITTPRQRVLDLELTIIRGLRHSEDKDLRIAAAQREEELEKELALTTNASRPNSAQ